jgi:hypothetical protein
MDKIELIDRAAVRALAYVSSDWTPWGHPLVVEVSDIDDLPAIDAEWGLFQRITDAYYDKQVFFLQDDGSVYDREEAVYHSSTDAAIDAFIRRISDGI